MSRRLWAFSLVIWERSFPASQSSYTPQRKKGLGLRFQKRQKGCRQLRAGPLGLFQEGCEFADKANSLHSPAAAPCPRPAAPTLSHQCLFFCPTKDTAPRTFQKLMHGWSEGLRPRGTLGHLRWVFPPAQDFTQTRDNNVYPPKLFHMSIVFILSSSLAV